jgi:hypothetical protein
VSDTDFYQAVKVLILISAGAAFVWWQLRDVRQAQERSRRERESRDKANHGADSQGAGPASRDGHGGAR